LIEIEIVDFRLKARILNWFRIIRTDEWNNTAELILHLLTSFLHQSKLLYWPLSN